jgi:spore coat protein U-like protein
MGSTFTSLLALGMLPAAVLGAQILQTSGFSTCLDNSNFTVQNLDIQYNNDNQTVNFNVAGSSTAEVNVTATINVVAYGKNVYSNSFNPCDKVTFVKQLCPGMYYMQSFLW